MLLVHIGIALLRQFQFQCAPTKYVNSLNKCFSPETFFHEFLNYFLMFQCKENVEMNKLLCGLACTWITMIDSQFYIIDSLSLDVSLE